MESTQDHSLFGQFKAREAAEQLGKLRGGALIMLILAANAGLTLAFPLNSLSAFEIVLNSFIFVGGLYAGVRGYRQWKRQDRVSNAAH